VKSRFFSFFLFLDCFRVVGRTGTQACICHHCQILNGSLYCYGPLSALPFLPCPNNYNFLVVVVFFFFQVRGWQQRIWHGRYEDFFPLHSPFLLCSVSDARSPELGTEAYVPICTFQCTTTRGLDVRPLLLGLKSAMGVVFFLRLLAEFAPQCSLNDRVLVCCLFWLLCSAVSAVRRSQP